MADHPDTAPDTPGTVEWPVFPSRTDIVFHGHYQETGGALIIVETPDGESLGLLQHHIRHSPDGFQWGYEGSGAAETARCLLLAALDDTACPTCNGTRKTRLDGDGSPERPLWERAFNPESDDPGDELVFACGDCDDGLIHLPYQDFKREFVAQWVDGDWRMSRSDIRTWLAQHNVRTR